MNTVFAVLDVFALCVVLVCGGTHLFFHNYVNRAIARRARERMRERDDELASAVERADDTFTRV